MNRTTIADATVFPATSLVAQAAAKALPLHQHMDTDTLRWIASHNGAIPRGERPRHIRLPAPARSVLHQAPIPASWRQSRALTDSLHGTRHLLRTAVLAGLLAQRHQLDTDSQAAVIVAAAIHDCRRIDDGADPGHGQRAALWLADHAETVFDHFGITPSPQRISAAIAAVRLHEAPYSVFTDRDHAEHAAHRAAVDVLKTADALDRYRLPRRTWWPHHKFLRLLPEPWMHRLAFDLVVSSESAYLAGQPSAPAVQHAFARKELV
jgi:hypothetical protein